MIEQLFGSKTRVKLLKLFFANPNRSFYVREITRKIDEQINSVRRELANLLNVGVIKSETNNNRLYYEVNQTHEFYQALATIFGKPTPVGADARTRGAKPDPLSEMGNVELAIYSGQFTRDESSGIDVLIVGDINQAKLNKFMAQLEADEGKELRYTFMTSDEFNYRRLIKDRFIVNLLSSKKQILLDKNNLLVTAKE
ncbi:MAG: transcriptional regulator [Candidatus Saccharimonadales bacterium]